jgi:hypothetical protein
MIAKTVMQESLPVALGRPLAHNVVQDSTRPKEEHVLLANPASTLPLQELPMDAQNVTKENINRLQVQLHVLRALRERTAAQREPPHSLNAATALSGSTPMLAALAFIVKLESGQLPLALPRMGAQVVMQESTELPRNLPKRARIVTLASTRTR